MLSFVDIGGALLFVALARGGIVQIQSPADLARLVKTRRQALDLTQQDVADSAGITRQSLARIEHGNGGTSFVTVLRIFEKLGISLEATPPGKTDIDDGANTRSTSLSTTALAALGAAKYSAIAAAATAAQNTDAPPSRRTAPYQLPGKGRRDTHEARRAALIAAIEEGDPDRDAGHNTARG